MRNDSLLKRNLMMWAKAYNAHDFIENDPVQFPRKYMDSQVDAEVSGLLTALISFGSRKQIIKKAQELDDMFSGSPSKWLFDENYRIFENNDASFYRTITYSHLSSWCCVLHALLSHWETIESALLYAQSQTATNAHDTLKHLFRFKDNSCAKRIAMFLRWMVRNDGIVDLGLWHRMSSKDLIIPLDTHVHRMALELGITKRKTTDIKTAQEITDYFKTIWPDDPCLGDFALFGYGVNNK